MIKLRLHGTEKEMKQFIDLLDEIKQVQINSESDPYKDRGKSVYSRIYLDVEVEAK